MTTLNIEGKKVKVSDEFLSLSPEEQNRTVEEIARSMSIEAAPQRAGGMAQLNTGIAEGVGGLVDFLNPFDKQMGSAKTGLRNAMEAGDIKTTDEQPEGMAENFMRGTGEAASYLIPSTLVAKGLSAAPGMVGNIADDVFASMATKTGAVVEPVAGGISRMAGQATEDAGYPLLRPTAEIMAPMAAAGVIAGAGPAVRGALRAGEALPLAGAAIRTGKAAVGAVAPMTPAGARQQAREQLLREVGGDERARELGQMIQPATELNLTGAQQTGDPRLLSMEAAASDENPLIREALAERDLAGRNKARGDIDGMSGDVKDARQFFAKRLVDYRKGMQERADTSLQMARESVEGVGPRSSETSNSVRMTQKLNAEYEDLKSENRSLWAAVPKDASVATDRTRDAIKGIVESQAWARRGNVPNDLRAILDGGTPIEGVTTVNELHGLYSQMRQVSRQAMSGPAKNADTDRIAKTVADAVLQDIEDFDGPVEAASAIATARAHTAAMKETFEQGAVGRILRKTINTDEQISPETALSKTVGRGGADAYVANKDITGAAPGAAEDIADYARGRFADEVFDVDGEFTRRKASAWLRKNRELLNQYPALRAEFSRALGSAANAEQFAARAAIRSDLADKSTLKAFNSGQAQEAVKAILGADTPVKAARSIAATARKDKSGKALDGVKASLTDYLIGGATQGDVITGTGLKALLSKGETSDAMRLVFSRDEFDRLSKITDELAKMDAARKATPKGPVMDAAPVRLIETIAAVAGAKAGAATARATGGPASAGVSLQAAARGSKLATNFLDRLTNDKARSILYDAIQDPTLMRALLLEETGAELPKWAASKIAPYLIGGISQTGAE